MLLNKHNLNIAKIAPREESRYTLSAIHCSPNGTVCTDGHRLAHVTPPPSAKDESFPAIPNFTPSNGDSGTFLLSARAALEVSKAIPKKQTIPVLENASVNVSAETVSLAVTDLDSPRIFTENKLKGNFPDWQRVIPKPEERPLAIGVNARYLMDAAKLAMEFGSVHVTLRLGTPGESIVMECQNGDGQTMTQIVMPVSLR